MKILRILSTEMLSVDSIISFYYYYFNNMQYLRGSTLMEIKYKSSF